MATQSCCYWWRLWLRLDVKSWWWEADRGNTSPLRCIALFAQARAAGRWAVGWQVWRSMFQMQVAEKQGCQADIPHTAHRCSLLGCVYIPPLWTFFQLTLIFFFFVVFNLNLLFVKNNKKKGCFFQNFIHFSNKDTTKKNSWWKN